MNNEKIAKYIQNIFHLEDMTANDESYNRGVLHSNSWGKGITISWFIRDFGDGKDVVIRYTYTMGSYDIDIDSGMTAQEASKEIVQLIGRVLITQSDTVDPNTGMNNILSWPYNCNLAYVEYLIEALQYGNNEIESSRKPIKSGFAQRNAGIIMDKLDKCNQLIETCISISPDARLTRKLEELEDEVDDVATHAEMLSNGDEKIESSKKVTRRQNNTKTLTSALHKMF